MALESLGSSPPLLCCVTLIKSLPLSELQCPNIQIERMNSAPPPWCDWQTLMIAHLMPIPLCQPPAILYVLYGVVLSLIPMDGSGLV